jgi:hypothetical protein
MNLSDYSTRYPLGVKLSKPNLNLLFKLDNMGVEVGNPSEPRRIENPTSGYVGVLNPLVATLVEWVYRVYSTYDRGGAMNYRGTKVAIGTFDRVLYLILTLDKQAFADFID